MKHIRDSLLALAALVPAHSLYAQRPENVLVVVNDSSSVSRSIGEYYSRKRSIPQHNVCRIRTSEDESIPRKIYESEILGPVTRCLKAGIQEQILYIVTTLGVPLRIEGTPPPNGDTAAVDSELTLLYRDLKTGTPHPLPGMQPNPFYNQRGKPFSRAQYPIYLVTRLAAYDFAGVRALIDKALIAKNEGKFVIDKKSLFEGEGESWLTDAAIRLPKDRVIFNDNGEVVYNQKDVIAYASWGSNDQARKKRFVGFQWLPGAIATEFVSTDGRTFKKPPDNWNISDWKSQSLWFAGSPQTMSADYLLEGATGVSGHVDEPYLMATPHPEILLPAYYSGRNLAESFYMAIPFLSWQNIVVGDPLCTLGPPKP
jgi:uncharacterized protein (TIGR03790 family)